jgi:mRNA interferase MazF
MYQRGDIISVPFPFTDLSETKLRPALIISKQKDESFSLPIEKANVSIALPKTSFVNCHKVVTIAASIIQKKISDASPGFTKLVSTKIQELITELHIQHGATVSLEQA